MTPTYLAGAFERKDEIAEYAKELMTAGWSITSTWLADQTLQTAEYLNDHPEEAQHLALRDFNDVMSSRRVVVFTGAMGRGGHQVEMGAALAMGLEVVVVGPRVNLFCLLAQKWYADWEMFKLLELGVEEEREDDE